MSDARLKLFLARPSVEGARALLLNCRAGGRPPSTEVLRWLLTLPRWDGLSDELRELTTEGVHKLLPDRFEPMGLKPCSLGKQRHVIAHYDGPGGPYALVPGGRMTLGWDRQDVALTSLQRAAWNQANDDPAFVRFEQLLDVYLTPLRKVALEPFLVEVEPQSALDYIDDEVDRDEADRDEADRDEADRDEADRDEADVSPQVLLEQAVARQGLRLLTSDEWEHACRGGSRTVFRWGDDWPRGIPQGGSTDFAGHRVPNAFGLSLVSDPYQVECVAGGAVFRGGDGGGAVCGGRPQPEPWYSFASAFAYPVEYAAEDVDEFFEAAVVRRALSLPDDRARGAS